MGRKIFIIQGHPDNMSPHLCHGLAAAYGDGAKSAGHLVRVVDVADLDFPLLKSQQDFKEGEAPHSICEIQQDILWADHLVIIFPLWLGSMPALLKGFLEQVLRPGFAMRYRDSGFPEKCLKGRSARIIVTMGMPAFAYRWFYCAHGLKNLKRNILYFVGIKPVRTTLLGMVEEAGEKRRHAWLDGARKLGVSAR